ncbi:hypothetical protein T4E_12049, partial [Trichinella pseudospiralis]
LFYQMHLFKKKMHSSKAISSKMRGRFYVWEKQRLQIFPLLGKSGIDWQPTDMKVKNRLPEDYFTLIVFYKNIFLNKKAIAYFVVHVQNLALLKHMTEDNSTEEFPVIIGAIRYSFGIVLLSLSMILHDLKITEFKSNELPSTMECLRKNLWVTFYISGQLLITLFMLFLCVDQLRAVIYLKRPNMPTSRLANISVFIIVCVTAIVASWPWISSFWISGNSSTSKNCILFKTIVEKFYVTLQITFVVFDMVTVCLYSTIVAILLKEHKNSVLVPLAKLRRASTIAKRIMIPLIFTVFLQTIPNLVAIFHYYLRNCRQLRNIFWEVKATFFPFSALLFFFTQTNLGKCWLEKAKAFFYKYFHREQRQQQVSTVATVAKCS